MLHNGYVSRIYIITGVKKCGRALTSPNQKLGVQEQDLQQHSSVRSFASGIPCAP